MDIAPNDLAAERRPQLEAAAAQVAMSAEILEAVRSLESLIRQTAIPVQSRLWSRSDLMDYFQCSKTHSYRITGQPGFPPPKKIDGDQRWMAGEVIAWVEKQR